MNFYFCQKYSTGDKNKDGERHKPSGHLPYLGVLPGMRAEADGRDLPARRGDSPGEVPKVQEIHKRRPYGRRRQQAISQPFAYR